MMQSSSASIRWPLESSAKGWLRGLACSKVCRKSARVALEALLARMRMRVWTLVTRRTARQAAERGSLHTSQSIFSKSVKLVHTELIMLICFVD